MKSIIIIAILSSTVAYADAYSDMMSDVEFKSHWTETLTTNAGDVEITYNGMSREYKQNVFFDNAQKASDMIPDFLSAKGITGLKRCKDKKINAYDVTTEVLNRQDIYETVNWEDPNRSSLHGGKLLGLYDVGDGRSDPATIYTDIDLYNPDRTRIISHEMAHFWYDQYCLDRKKINSEEMAQEFEKFYKENFNDRKYQRRDSR